MSYPELDKAAIESAIVTLEQIDLSLTTISELSKIIEPLFNGYQTTVPILEPPIHIFRGRPCDKPQKLADLVYPPVAAVKELGRANGVGEQLFYGSVGRDIPFYELSIKPGETFMISFWRTTETLLLNHVGFTREAFIKLGSTRNIDDMHKLYHFVQKTRSASELNELVYNYLANVFTKKVADLGIDYYKLSSAIAKWLMCGEVLDGIIFPTVAQTAKAENVVLKPGSVDNKLKLIYVQFCELTDIAENGDISFEILDSATDVNIDGTLAWTGRTLAWSSTGNAIIANENEDYFARDKDGKPIYPMANGDLIVRLNVLQRRHRDYMSRWICVTTSLIHSEINGINTAIRIIVALDLKAGERYYSFHMSASADPIGLSLFFIVNYEQYLWKDLDNTEYHFSNGTAKSDELMFLHKFIIFSESTFDPDELRVQLPNYYHLEVFFA